MADAVTIKALQDQLLAAEAGATNAGMSKALVRHDSEASLPPAGQVQHARQCQQMAMPEQAKQLLQERAGQSRKQGRLHTGSNGIVKQLITCISSS